MKYTFKKWLYVLLLIGCTKTAAAQEESGVPSETMPIFTADSLVSGNTKDILTSFFQLAFSNLTGDNKEFNFNSNPFAVMLKSNPKLNMDHYYSKYKTLRNLNFGFGIKLDTSYKFNGFSSGVKYAIINERDHTTSRLFATNLKINGFLNERTALNAALRELAITRFDEVKKTNDADKIAAARQERNEFLKMVSVFFNQEKAFNQLDTGFQKTVTQLVKENELKQIEKLLTDNPGSSLKSNDIKVFEDLKDSIKSCALWTMGISDTTNKNQFAFSNLVINSEFSKGIFKPQPGANNVELNIKTACNFLKDTLQSGNNLKRIIFSFEPGINWVIRDKNNDKPMFELKLSGSYFHNFNSLYVDEERDKLTMNGTVRVRIYEDIWIPLDIKYDPKNGNVLGLLNVKANFTGLGKLLKGSTN